MKLKSVNLFVACLSLLLIVWLADGALAGGPFGLIKKQPVRNAATVAVRTVKAVANGVTEGLAQSKANQQAREGRMRHVGGGLGAGRYEGVGFSTVSGDDAIRKCCYWGIRKPIDIGVARGTRGFYATVIYK